MTSPCTPYRQIGFPKWENAIYNIIKYKHQSGDDTIVSTHSNGWVYIVQPDHNMNTFNCLTYKILTDPFQIKKELYNYVINNGALMDTHTIHM